MILDLVMAGDNDGLVWILAAGPAGAAATYWSLYRYYRNTDKSHEFERDTIIAAQPVRGGEQKIGDIGRTQDSDIDGDNTSNYRQRVQRLG